MLLAQEVLHAYTMISISMMVVFTSLSGEGGDDKHSGVRYSRDKSLPLNGVYVCVCVYPYEDNSKIKTFLEARTFELVLINSGAV